MSVKKQNFEAIIFQRLLLLFVLFIVQVFSLNCQVIESNKDLYVSDLRAWYQEGKHLLQLEAFNHTDNAKSLRENNTKKLKWYSIGHPLLKKSIINKTERFFHIGFHTYIQYLLTNPQKTELLKAAKAKYNVVLELSQIDNFFISSFTCKLDLYEGNNETVKSIAYGSAKPPLNSPILISFDLPPGSKILNLFKKNYKTVEDLEIECEVRSNDLKGFVSKFSLKTEKFEPNKESECCKKISKNSSISTTRSKRIFVSVALMS